MRHYLNFNKSAVTDLFNNHLVTAPLPIRAYIGSSFKDAQLLSDGSVVINNNTHSDLQAAMDATLDETESTSDAWQFWTWFSDERQAWTPLEHLRAKNAYKDEQSEIRTSDSHPLRIDYVEVPNTSGRIGLTFCPGKCSEGLYGGTWERDLNKDLAAIKAWGATTLITLMEAQEFEIIGVPQFMEVLTNSDIGWHHLPIQDMQPPSESFEVLWKTVGPQLHKLLSDGQDIVIHCRGGLGRTGLLAARMLVEAGMTPVDAVAEVRNARKHSIETYAQEHYVLTQHWKK
ncbi:cyclin-dependent kinase inhibitor 3 family protein [Dasania sp. GY-MA-18]|uniref:protein-tyrosine-phosphatase n=1 Tax=Dasania phycosphaerae TaxID=2950436 RepID=A0A9J6RKN8_9GAMM|nr:MULTISPECIES: cyclin-dependent kinase inhibitor 3 family protein [Dasania]MCR8922331.1 cyclin-dependent kinase inhibitor 3 family protein [Dasania sp. GY-MA-18]MCZ0864759.1 cyclin-dependent kinase inhibitor 3 family protein [Dasania phycosphaerae]MCZ0868487.1 cyclin-dependent kinase inhibitor 3 family protein [Dasania phycosphaerae]